MEQIRRSLYRIGQLIWIQIWIQIDERCAGSSFLFNGFRRFGRVDSSIQVPPPLATYMKRSEMLVVRHF